MTDNEYAGVFEKRELELIRQWAKQARLRADQVPDVLQEVAMVVIKRPDDWSSATGPERKQVLWVLTRNVLGETKRAERRRCQRDEEKALMTDEAYFETTPIQLDVQEVVAGLNERGQAVCDLLSQGLSKSQIAERMQCGWHTVDRIVRDIRRQFEEQGFGEE